MFVDRKGRKLEVGDYVRVHSTPLSSAKRQTVEGTIKEFGEPKGPVVAVRSSLTIELHPGQRIFEQNDFGLTEYNAGDDYRIFNAFTDVPNRTLRTIGPITLGRIMIGDTTKSTHGFDGVLVEKLSLLDQLAGVLEAE